MAGSDPLNTHVSILINRAGELQRAIRELTSKEVLVGVPEAKTDRNDPKPGMTNAALAYIHNYGSPAANIPARPFLEPGINNAKEEIVRRFEQMGKAALEGRLDAVEKGLEAVGLTAQNSVRRKITEGPFVPLKPGTIRGRKRKRKSRSNKSIKPLIDTGALRQSISYAVRETK